MVLAIGNQSVTPAAQYALYDVLSTAPKSQALAEFDSLTGGDQVISMVTYNVIDANGGVTTKIMPGQTTFEPITLLRPMDAPSKSMMDLIRAAIEGKCERRDISVSMNDAQGNPLVWWDLFGAVPIKLSGFSFNSKVEAYYTDFEITFQAEDIKVTFI